MAPAVKCQCVVPEGKKTFWCERHKCKKNLHLLHLCKTRPDYFEAWEKGRGAGQSGPADDQDHKAPSNPPSLSRQAWNLARALADFVADGCKTVTADEYRRRLEICDTCDQRRNNRCMKCGCRLSLKARGRAFACPLDQWLKV